MSNLDQPRGRGQRPSDAPNRTSMLLRLLRDHRRLEQHQRNLSHARRWVEATRVALQRVDQQLDVVFGSLNHQSNFNDADFGTCLASLHSLMNARIDQRLLFGGTAIGEVAFDDQGFYRGNDLPVLHQLTDDIVLPLGFTGSRVFLADGTQPANSLITILRELRACLAAGDSTDDPARRRAQLVNQARQIGEQIHRAIEQLQRQHNRLTDLEASTTEAMVAVHSHWVEAHRRTDTSEVDERASEASVDATLQATNRALANSLTEFLGTSASSPITAEVDGLASPHVSQHHPVEGT